ncbi:von Hippel-Lindau disease tumor suppressor [Pelodytes ibericus]
MEQDLPELRIRSRNSCLPAHVLFCNRSHRTVQPLWVNFQGEPQPYPSLAPGTARRMLTYLGHMWLFRDLETNVGLLANKKEVYLPSANVNGQPSIVNISSPAFTLKEHCIHFIRKIVKPEDYRKLDIVASLYDDLENQPNVERELRRLAFRFWNEPRLFSPDAEQ